MLALLRNVLKKLIDPLVTAPDEHLEREFPRLVAQWEDL
jgi:hypothetical protein